MEGDYNNSNYLYKETRVKWTLMDTSVCPYRLNNGMCKRMHLSALPAAISFHKGPQEPLELLFKDQNNILYIIMLSCRK